MNEHLLSLINNYQPPEKAQRLVAEHPSLNMAGPTGVGKGTFAAYLTQSHEYAPVVSDTTRPPRPHNDGFEVNGVHYWFISEEEAEKKIADGAYIETKPVHGKTMYGTSIDAYEKVVQSGRTPLLEIDVQGMEELMKRFPTMEAIFLLPPDFDIWQARLDGRGSMDLEDKLARFRSAVKEMQRPIENPRFFPVVNTEVIDTAKVIMSGEYRDPEYRARATKIAKALIERTNDFLSHYDTTA